MGSLNCPGGGGGGGCSQAEVLFKNKNKIKIIIGKQKDFPPTTLQ